MFDDVIEILSMRYEAEDDSDWWYLVLRSRKSIGLEMMCLNFAS